MVVGLARTEESLGSASASPFVVLISELPRTESSSKWMCPPTDTTSCALRVSGFALGKQFKPKLLKHGIRVHDIFFSIYSKVW